MPWLMKAEPDSRVVKGKDVKFSVDDFEAIGTSPWDGVRSHEAKKIMNEKMKLGDEVLFYHSNCKSPGVFALAEVAREGYPDSWDASHPYFDAKSSKDEPTWYMASLAAKITIALPALISVLIKHLVSLAALPEQVSYIGAGGFKALKEMALVNRGRLSVQPVTPEAYEAVVLLGTKGGWDDVLPPGKKTKAATPVKSEAKGATKGDEDGAGKQKSNGTKRKTKAVKKAADDSELSELEEQVTVENKEVDERSTPTGARRSKRTRR